MRDIESENDLKQQILEMMKEEEQEKEENMEREKQRPSRDSRDHVRSNVNSKKKRKKRNRVIKMIGIIAVVLLFILALLLGTKAGRKLLIKMGSNFVSTNTQSEDVLSEYDFDKNLDQVRDEKYVTNYLIFGIEEIKGARNTDSMMIATINTKDNSIKLTSLLRDSYVEIPGYKSNKLNSAYAKGGVSLLIDTIELNYKVNIDGYASVNFASFEKIVDLLGGVNIELGEKEAAYLNKTNYISKKENRKVKPGMNKLNGNQVMGYVRVRKVATLGGAHSDYGRVVRQQRALQAIMDSAMSPKNLVKIIPLSKEILGEIKTSLTNKQIEKAMEAVIENKITKMDTFRVPVDGTFDSPKKYNGIGYPLVINWDVNRVELYKFIYGDTEEQAKEALAKFQN